MYSLEYLRRYTIKNGFNQLTCVMALTGHKAGIFILIIYICHVFAVMSLQSCIY